MLRCLSKKLICPLFNPLAISFPTWCGLRRSIMFNDAHRFSVSAPDEAPTNSGYRSLPCKLFFSTWSAMAVGTFLFIISLHPFYNTPYKDEGENILRIPNTRKPRPSNRSPIREQVDQILRLSKLLEVRGALNAASQERRSSHDSTKCRIHEQQKNAKIKRRWVSR